MHLLPLRKKVLIEKVVGETPLQTIERFKASHPRYRDISATYAGRLDPMASGKLLVLFGEECKKKEHYIGLDKEYEVEVLLGVGSDTGDMLGEIMGSNEAVVEREEIQNVLKKETGTFTLPYPAFSSKTIAGKPLFMYALDGTLDTITIPTHEETIYSIQLKKILSISSTDLSQTIDSLLELAPKNTRASSTLGEDFRIGLVRDSWEKIFEKDQNYTIIQIKVRTGSGAYMRTLAERIGKNLGTSALALSIKRTRLG